MFLFSALILSCVFLLLVLLVYGLIRELRNLNGMVLMAYVSTLFVTFCLRVAMIIGNKNRVLIDDDCKALGMY